MYADSISCAFGFTRNRWSSIGHSVDSSMPTTSVDATAMVGTRYGVVEYMGGHEPHTQHHAEDGREHRHDDGDGDARIHRRVIGAGESIALCGER